MIINIFINMTTFPLRFKVQTRDETRLYCTQHKIECNLEDLRNSIFYSALTDENGNILVDENVS